MPDRYELDQASPNNPVYISGLFGNWGKPPGYTALNTRGLALNGITKDSQPRCPGIEICRDTQGEPTGILIENNMRPAIEFDLLPEVPRFRFKERYTGVQLSQQLYNKQGTTSIYEGHGSAPESISVYRKLWEHRALTVRVGLVVSPSWSGLAEVKTAMRDWMAYARGCGLGDTWLKISGVHIHYGGDSNTAQCARMNLPDTGWAGFVEQVHSPEDFREACFLAAENNLRLHTIVSDKLHEIAPTLEAVNEKYPLAGRRWIIEHIARARRSDLETLKRLDVLATTIPTAFIWKDGAKYLSDPEAGELVRSHAVVQRTRRYPDHNDKLFLELRLGLSALFWQRDDRQCDRISHVAGRWCTCRAVERFASV
jgi:predicted amidohydrolase YtcJ